MRENILVSSKELEVAKVGMYSFPVIVLIANINHDFMKTLTHRGD